MIVRLAILCLLLACSLPAFNQAEAILEEVRQTYAPDRRVVRFDVEVEGRGKSLTLAGETSSAEAKEALMERLRKAGFKLRDRIGLLPDTAGLEGNTWGVVRLSACNIRSEPRHSAELSTQSTLGTPLRVHKKEGDWYLVQTPDRYFGWLDAGGFTLMDPSEYQAWATSDRIVYVPDFGFSYQAPASGSLPVSDLLAGNILRHTTTRDGWVEVAYPDGRRAFIPESAVEDYDAWLSGRKPEAQAILQTARTFLGRPYLWGGTSGKGVDCSGFTKSVFYLHGLMLPRDASQQVHVGYAVDTGKDWTNLQPGDLLFFGRKATGGRPERIVHVAIYQGDGRIIHAAGTVKEDSLIPGDPDFNEYRYNTFVRARRMLDRPEAHGVFPLRSMEIYSPSGG